MNKRNLLTVVTVVLVLAAALGARPTHAREVRLPLTAGPEILRDALVQQVFSGPGQRAQFWGDPGECSFFYLEDPKVEGAEGKIRIVAHGEARLGTEFLGACLSPIVWSGYLEVFETPRLEGWTVRFDVADSNVYDERRKKALLTGALWDRIKRELHPRLESVRVDLGEPFRQLEELLPVWLPDPAATGALQTLQPTSVSASPEGVTVVASLDVTEPPAAPVAGAEEPPLRDEEIEAFTSRLDQWDAFLTFVIRELGQRALRDSTRDALLVVLIEARFAILESLREPARDDPVRRLFVSAWEQIRPVADEIAGQVPGGAALRLLTFVAAGDALATLDEVGPTFGLEISDDGMRRMARLMQPDVTADPLDYTPWIDPKLRFYLGFGSPLDLGETPGGNGSRWSWPRPAYAASGGSVSWKEWVLGGRGEVHTYLERVGKLLDETIDQTLRDDELSGVAETLFRRIVPAAAWQESCWRQFEQRRGQVDVLRSPQGSVGILQVNERVWRGFYEPEKLRWNIAYNARAGAEIMLRYQRLAADRGVEIREDSLAEAGRAIYATYNGGPGQLRRYLSGQRGPALTRVIDGLFGKKFDTAPKDIPREVARCLVGG